MTEKVKVRIRRYRVNLEPEINVFHVEVERDGGVYEATCATPELLIMFLQGVQAGSEEDVSLPEIPVIAETLPSQLVPTDDDIPF